MMIRAFDLFCGAGGSSCGARMAGVEPIGGIDLWDTAVETFRLNFPAAAVYGRPIKSLSASQIVRAVGPVDLLIASPECTNHSVAKGSAPRDEDSRRTAFEVIRFAKAWRPRWIVVENVVSMQRWESYEDWHRKLKGLGYYTTELKLNAEDFGVAQNRRRLFVVADLNGPPKTPNKPRRKKRSVRSILHRGSINNGFSYEMRPLFGARRAEPTLEHAKRAISALGASEAFLIVYYGSDAAGGWQSLDRPLRTITTLDRFALVRPNGRGHEMRMLQPPELAAAMGFPKNYRWPMTTRREQIMLIGNAVSPPVMQAVVKALVS